MAKKNFFDSSWSWILGLLTGIPFHAFKDIATDEYGANAVDREYVAYLKRMVENGELTEEEARKRISEGYSGKIGTTSDEFYDSVGSDVGKGISLGSAGNGLTGILSSLVAYFTRNELTGAEREQNAFNAEEAQKSRDFTEYMARNKYTMETQSMQDAGVNPAVVYGGGNLVPTAANGAAGHGSPIGGGNITDLLGTLVRMPLELKQLKAEISAQNAAAQKSRDEGWAARENAITNRMNAGTQQGELGVHEREVAVREAELVVKKELKDNEIRLTDEQIRKLTEERLNIAEATKYISKNWEVANKNANAAQKQALAAMRQADAAVQNAATNDYLSTYQTDMLYSQRLGQDIMNGKTDLEMKYLPEKLQAEIKEFQARGFYFTAQGELANKNKALVTAQTIRQYELMVTDVANAAVNVAGAVATGGLSGAVSSPSVSYDPAPANGTFGTYGDVGTTYWYGQ